MDGQRLTHILAVAQGSDTRACNATAPVLFAAHCDTIAHSPGADDNATAVAIALDLVGHAFPAPGIEDVAFVTGYGDRSRA